MNIKIVILKALDRVVLSGLLENSTIRCPTNRATFEVNHPHCFSGQINGCRVRGKSPSCLDSSKPTLEQRCALAVGTHLLWAMGLSLLCHSRNRCLKFTAEATAIGSGKGTPVPSQLSAYSRALEGGSWH